MFATGVPDQRVEKTMSFTQTEFENGLNRLTNGALGKTDQGHYDLSAAADGKPVSCSFEPQPDAVLSPLVRMPRVRVVLDMSSLDDEARSDFLLRFEKTFQRGGG